MWMSGEYEVKSDNTEINATNCEHSAYLYFLLLHHCIDSLIMLFRIQQTKFIAKCGE